MGAPAAGADAGAADLPRAVAWCGGSTVEHAPVWTPDGALLLVAAGVRVDVHRVDARGGGAYGGLARSLVGHRAAVTALALNPANGAQCYTASADGTLRAWDYRDGTQLRCVSVGLPIVAMALPPTAALSGGAQKAYVSVRWLKAAPGAQGADGGKGAGAGDSGGSGGAGGGRKARRKGKGGGSGGVDGGAVASAAAFAAAADSSAAATAGLDVSASASGRVLQVDLATGRATAVMAKTKGAAPHTLLTSPGGTWLGALVRRRVLLWRLGAAHGSAGAGASGAESPVIAMRHTKELTCLAFDEDDSRLAVGDATGRVLLWHALGDAAVADAGARAGAMDVDAGAGSGGGSGGAEAGGDSVSASAACTTVRWHAGPVGCLTFTQDGAELLSGGAEAVLVRWRLEGGPTPVSFLPRLGGALLAAARSPADGAAYALCCGDNAVRVVSTATMRVVAAVTGLRPAPARTEAQQQSLDQQQAQQALARSGGEFVSAAAGRRWPDDPYWLRAPLAWDAGARCAVLAAPHCALQMYEPRRGSHVGEVRVACRAPARAAEASAKGAKRAATDAAEEEETLRDVRVAAAGVSPDARTLATVEVRPAVGAARNEYCLKLWHRREGAPADAWELATRVDTPHRRRVTSLSFHPGSRMAATTSKDGTLKVWEAQGVAAAGEKALPAWGCRSSMSHRGEPMGAGAFSWDGSLLAGAAGACVALWDARNASPRATLAAAPAGGRERAVVQLAFVSGTPYLAAAEAKGGRLVVWDLLTRSVWWSYTMDVVGIAPAPHAPLLAVAVTAGGTIAAAVGDAGSGGKDTGAGSAAGSAPVHSLGHILLMDVATAAPVKAWRCARAPPAALAYAPALARAAAVSDGDGADADADAEEGEDLEGEEIAEADLVVSLASRELVVLSSNEAGPAEEVEAAAGAPAGEAEAPIGALDRILGVAATADDAAMAAGSGLPDAEAAAAARGSGALAAALARGIAADVRDVPSHALPPLSGVALKALERALGLASI